MKKILALIAALGLIMACGGNSGNSGKSKMTVEEKAIDYLEQVSEANENYDYETLEKVYKEMEVWYNGLSEEDQAKADAAAEKYMLGEYGDDEEYYDADVEEHYDADVEEYYDADDEEYYDDDEYYDAESESDDEDETDFLLSEPDKSYKFWLD